MKEYIKPESTTIKVNCGAIIALSVQGDTEVTNDNIDAFEMFGRDDNKPSNPNIWEQGW